MMQALGTESDLAMDMTALEMGKEVLATEGVQGTATTVLKIMQVLLTSTMMS
jgi:hypothetical protein